MNPFGIDWTIPRNLHFDGEPIVIYESARSNKNTYSMVTCTAGIKRLMVEPDGNILRCTKRVGGSLAT